VLCTRATEDAASRRLSVVYGVSTIFRASRRSYTA
jgi:hypothetical protein